MKYFLDWKDYTKQPAIKRLIESKGLEFVKKKYQQDMNRLLWNDPFKG